MKKVILSAVAVLTVAAALPAAAQAYYGGTYDQYGRPQHDPRAYHQQAWTPIGVRFERLDNRIERGLERGLLTRREAGSLRYEFRQLVQLERHYGRGGLSYNERADLERRLDRLSQRIRWERRDGDQRGDRRFEQDERRYRPHGY